MQHQKLPMLCNEDVWDIFVASLSRDAIIKTPISFQNGKNISRNIL